MTNDALIPSVLSRSHLLANCFLFVVLEVIGVAIYGELGHVPSTSNGIFSGHFRAGQTLTLDSMWFPTVKKDTGPKICHCLVSK